MGLERILQEIERLREELERKGAAASLTSPAVLALSQRLDALVAAYLHLQEQERGILAGFFRKGDRGPRRENLLVEGGEKVKPTIPPFVQQVKDRDPELYEAVTRVIELAMSPGALDAKTKTFIALALDAFVGSERGVASLANRARELGATEQEINEVLRIAYYIAGMRTLATSNHAFPQQG